ncbi:MAG: energy transducer TonB [Mucilaginibacter sp.]
MRITIVTILFIVIPNLTKAQTDTTVHSPAAKPETTYVAPTAAQKKLINSKVLFSFIVEKDGTLSDIKILRGLSPELDTIALQKLKNSPKWKPAIVNGHPIRKR